LWATFNNDQAWSLLLSSVKAKLSSKPHQDLGDCFEPIQGKRRLAVWSSLHKLRLNAEVKKQKPPKGG